MRLRHLLATAALALGAALSPASAAFDRLYVFGDSLVDSGNARTLSALPGSDPSAAQLAALYPSGRFTNGVTGRNFADYLGRALGLGDTSPYVDSLVAPGPGTNFAVGGATTVFTDGEKRPDLLSEIKGLPASATSATQPNPYDYNYTYAAQNGLVTPIDANSLVLIASGGNDVRGFTAGTDVAAFVGGVAQATVASLDALYAAGARNFVMIGVPNIGLIPEVNGDPAKAAGAALLSAALNQSYASIAAGYSAKLGDQGLFRLIDIASLQADIVVNPEKYGLARSAVGKSCLRDGGLIALAGNCAGYAYYDTIHPTDQVHQLIAGAIVSQLPEPASWAMLIVGFGLTGTALRRARRETATA